MGRPSFRWAIVAAFVAVLAALPALATVLPGQAPAPSAASLLARIRGSQAVGWSGYGESRGALALPDVRELGDLPALFGGTTRTRTWWRGPRDARIDTLTATGEADLALDASGAWIWDSADQRAIRLVGEPAVRLPRAGDLVPPVLGRRLARTTGVRATLLAGVRVAGQRTAGLRLSPPPGQRSTVDHVDLYALPASGLVLRVDVVAGGQQQPVLTSLLLDLTRARPAAALTAFTPPPQATVTAVQAPDVAAAIDRFAPFALPARLAGLPRLDRVAALRELGGVATYGAGFGLLTVVPLPRDLARTIIRRVDPQDRDGRATVRTPLVDALVARVGRRAYLIAGTVPPAVLTAALDQLAADPPARVR